MAQWTKLKTIDLPALKRKTQSRETAGDNAVVG
jgi:hypothetical protein